MDNMNRESLAEDISGSWCPFSVTGKGGQNGMSEIAT